MSTACPNCGSRYLRESRPRSFEEKINRLRFISPLRCMDCKTRFIASTFVLSDFFYARCPECLRMDLGMWTGKTHEPPFFMRVKISFGAKRWRCEYCRINFASFRPRKEIFTFKRWQNRRAQTDRNEKTKERTTAE